MSEPERPVPNADHTLARQILPLSASMIGVCTALIGLVKIVEARIGPSHVDEYAGVTALIFLASTAAAYASIRHPERSALSHGCERMADWCFLVGLVGLTAIVVFFAYEVI